MSVSQDRTFLDVPTRECFDGHPDTPLPGAAPGGTLRPGPGSSSHTSVRQGDAVGAGGVVSGAGVVSEERVGGVGGWHRAVEHGEECC